MTMLPTACSCRPSVILGRDDGGRRRRHPALDQGRLGSMHGARHPVLTGKLLGAESLRRHTCSGTNRHAEGVAQADPVPVTRFDDPAQHAHVDILVLMNGDVAETDHAA